MSDKREEPLHYGPSRLQTYTIWRPTPSPTSPPTSSAASASSRPPLWIIYVHGGAWRDPLQSSANILPTIKHLTSSSKTHPIHAALDDPTRFAGILSIDYRLSPYPTHPTSPSSPTDPDRNVQHPTHVRDLAAAVAFFKREYNVRRWVGVGHSCGATMLLSLAAGIGFETEDEADTHVHVDDNNNNNNKPLPLQGQRTSGLESLILLEGIYSLPLLLANHAVPAVSPSTAQIYRTIARSAFGPDDHDGALYDRVSPVSGSYTAQTWRDARLVVLGYSGEDELVERAQGDVFVPRLVQEGWVVRETLKAKGKEGAVGVVEEEDEEEGQRVVLVKELKGTHNFVWTDGAQIADLIREVVEALSV